MDQVTLHHHCRRCRTKLAEPVENQRNAFCCRGCYRYFFIIGKRCLGCEKQNDDLVAGVCRKADCRKEWAALRRYGVAGKYAASGPKSPEMGGSAIRDAIDAANPIKIGVCEPVTAALGYRIVAGGPLSPRDLELATVGAAKVLAENRRTNRAYLTEGSGFSRPLFGPKTPPLNIIGGYRFPGSVEARSILVPAWGEVGLVSLKDGSRGHEDRSTIRRRESP